MSEKGGPTFSRSRDVTNTKSKIFPLRVGSLTSWNRKLTCMISDKK